MRSKNTCFISTLIGTVFALMAVNANAAGYDTTNNPTNTQATSTATSALDACNGKSDGDTCTFVQDKKQISGSCERSEDGHTICKAKQ